MHVHTENITVLLQSGLRCGIMIANCLLWCIKNCHGIIFHQWSKNTSCVKISTAISETSYVKASRPVWPQGQILALASNIWPRPGLVLLTWPPKMGQDLNPARPSKTRPPQPNYRPGPAAINSKGPEA